MTMPTLLLCRDLMAISSISGAARGAGQQLRTVNSAQELLEAAKPADVVLLDLGTLTDPAEIKRVITALKQQSPPPRVVAFGPHVHEHLLQQAREAGADAVLARGQFLNQIGRWLGA
jgi:CheY-like chemotaxis protein